MYKKVLLYKACLVAWFVISLLIPVSISAFVVTTWGEGKPQIAPLNPAFVEYMNLCQTIRPPVQITADGHALGFAPSPVDRSYLKKATVISKKPIAQLPISYDLRGLGRVTPVRDQGSCGSCWTFGTMASLESCLLTEGETYDFSENNLKECHGFTYGPCDGGNADMSTAYFARRGGPVAENDAPYYDYVTGCSSGLPVQKYLREVWYLPPTDIIGIKNAIMNYGAIYTAFYWGSSYYDPNNYTYYYTGSNDTNHAVAIVGWDDDFDKSLFPGTPPPGNGAWIYKNSWGTSWGDNGYFYVSYYDHYAAAYSALFFEAHDPEDSIVYQYDPLGWVGSYGYSSTTAWGANVFTASQAGYLSRVAFYTTDVNTNYHIYIKNGGPDGTVLYDQSGTYTYPGYHTVDLTTSVPLSNGETFTVAVEFNNSTYNYPVAVEYSYSGYSDAATANPGESYMSPDGSPGSWYDLTNSDSTMNVCIKAIVWPTAQATTSVFRVNNFGSVFADSAYYGAGFYSGSADMAEWVPVSEPVEPGDVLELDPENPGHYRKSRGPCSDLVAGVVSTKPGFALGSRLSTEDSGLSTPDRALLALVGIVPVKVTDEGGPIQPGDLLVSSSTPGYAMRWSGSKSCLCALVGKALSSLDSGSGVIDALLAH